jgi:peptide deformylase
MTTPTEVRPRWARLDEQQRALAAELAERAARIHAQALEGMSWAQAVDLAAAQLGYDDRTAR